MSAGQSGLARPHAADSGERTIRLATRGSALALTQAEWVRGRLAEAFPKRRFELTIIKTTGDRLPTASLANAESALPRGLFTKELEAALLAGDAEIAVHSLKDLPTELPAGLLLAATPAREDAREVLLYRNAAWRAAPPREQDWRPGQREPWFGRSGMRLFDLPPGAIVATSSTRRAAAVRMQRADLVIVPIRGNVGTRLLKLRDSLDIDATLLAAAGLRRLNFDLGPGGVVRLDPRLSAKRRAELTPPPEGLLAVALEPEELLPAVGQGALGLEIRAEDEDARRICETLNHANTLAAVTAERALLEALGGGCQSPVAAYARVVGHQLRLRAAWYRDHEVRQAEASRPARDARELGQQVARELARVS